MPKHLLQSLFVLLFVLSSGSAGAAAGDAPTLLAASAVVVQGKVVDRSGSPVAGATVSASGITTESDGAGGFRLDMGSATATLRIEHPRYAPVVLQVQAPAEIIVTLVPLPSLSEEVVVSAIRADQKTPITRTDLSRGDLDRMYYGQDIPLMLRDTPSVTAYAESGVGNSGYSYITLRGISPTRINMTFDGVPLNDSEDMGFYFANLTDLAGALQDIQIQRGVGTSSVGAPSFGGSINFASADPKPVGEIRASLGGGSYGARRGAVAWDSGLHRGFAITGRLALNDIDGFRTSSGVRQHSLYLTAEKTGDNSLLRITGFSGHERSQLSFFAADADTLKSDLRANPLSAEDRDSFGQDMVQMQLVRSVGSATVAGSVYYNRGYGSYRLWDDEATRTALGEYGLDGRLLGTMLTVTQVRGRLSAIYGLHLNEFQRKHTFGVVGEGHDYENLGRKSEESAFAKLSWDAGPLHLYSDMQFRSTDFRYHGDVEIPPIRWTFFNPKLGARYDLTQRSSIYGSAGLSRREPTRNDLFQGEDNASFAHDLHAVKPERLADFEAGADLRSSRATFHANIYAMEFRNEIASTGELSDIGLLLRRNVRRSYRRGVEVEGTWKAAARLTVRGTGSFSRNRINEWTQFYDRYDENGDFIDSVPIVHRNVEPVLTPAVLATLSAEARPLSFLTATVGGRYVARSFLDNTDNSAFVTPSFVALDASVALSLQRWIPRGQPRLMLQADNLLNNRRLFASGYSYLFINRDASGGESISGISYYYPLATRNVSFKIGFRL
jgi:iron complex outermembrane receptor protein